MIVNIRSTIRPHQTHQHRQAQANCSHSGHAHLESESSFQIRESYVELPHAAIEAFGEHHHDSAVVGVAHGAVSALATMRGIQQLKMGGAVHTIEGVGQLALAGASGLGAYSALFGGEEHGHHHHHEHGIGLGGALEITHGLAEIAVAGLEVKQEGRKAISLVRMAKGASTLAAHLVPGAASVAHAVHLGTVVALAAMDPKH